MFQTEAEQARCGLRDSLDTPHAWWHKIGSPPEAAEAASDAWEGERHPGDRVNVLRHLKDGHEEAWRAAEVRPHGSKRAGRAVVATTDPENLPDRATWYLLSKLPHPATESAKESELASTHLAQILRL